MQTSLLVLDALERTLHHDTTVVLSLRREANVLFEKTLWGSEVKWGLRIDGHDGVLGRRPV